MVLSSGPLFAAAWVFRSSKEKATRRGAGHCDVSLRPNFSEPSSERRYINQHRRVLQSSRSPPRGIPAPQGLCDLGSGPGHEATSRVIQY